MNIVKHQITLLTRDAISAVKRHKNSLNADQIVIFLIKNDHFLNNVDDIFFLLSREEQAHALKRPILDVRRRYIIQKGWLRLLLSEFLDCSVGTIEFAIGRFGKPSLKNAHHRVLHFNISHSNHYTLMAFAKDYHVGIDVEDIPTESAPSRILEAIGLATTPSEKKTLDALLPAARVSAFLKLWTKKEAISKVLGIGLNMDFTDLEIGLDEDQPPRFFYSQEINLVDISISTLFFASLAFAPH